MVLYLRSNKKNPREYVSKVKYTIIDIITKDEYSRIIDTGLSNNKTYSEVYLPKTYSTNEIKIEFSWHSLESENGIKTGNWEITNGGFRVTPTLRVGVIHDFIKNTLNDKHSFDFQDKEKLHWNVNTKLDTCFDTLYGTTPVGRENPLDWITSPHIEPYIPPEFTEDPGFTIKTPLEIGKLDISNEASNINLDYQDTLYNIADGKTYYLKFELQSDVTEGYVQFIEKASSLLTVKIEILDKDGNVINDITNTYLDYGSDGNTHPTAIGSSSFVSKLMNTRLSYTSLAKGTYYFKLTNMDKNPGLYRIYMSNLKKI